MMTKNSRAYDIERQSTASALLKPKQAYPRHELDVWEEMAEEEKVFTNPGNIYEQRSCAPVDRSQIANLTSADDIRPGAVIELCDVLGSRVRAIVISLPYVRTLAFSGRSHMWFDIKQADVSQPTYHSMEDEGIIPIDGDVFHQHHWTELVQAAE